MSKFLGALAPFVIGALAFIENDQDVLGGNLTLDAASCPNDIPLSCSNSTPVENSCCFEYPGGVLLQTQFWDYSPAIGDDKTFTLHGLWPDNCDGTYNQFCNNKLDIQDAKKVVLDEFNDEKLYESMNKYWLSNNGNDDSLWVHEYNKHGTCINTLEPKCYGDSYKKNKNVVDYYTAAVTLYGKLNTYEFLEAEGITPSESTTYSKEQISSALEKHFGKKVYFKCDGSHALNEIWYFHHLKGSLRLGQFDPMDALLDSKCPDNGIRFPPKGSKGGKKPPTSGTKGYLKVPGKSGCAISNGHWYEAGTCATYRLVPLQFGGYSIRSSKGYCAVNSDNQFNCGSGNSPMKNQFQVDKSSGEISYGGKSKWCFDYDHKIGHGSTAQTPIKLASLGCDSFSLKLTGK